MQLEIKDDEHNTGKCNQSRGYKMFSIQLRMKFQLLIKTKMLKKYFSCKKTLEYCIYLANKCLNVNIFLHFKFNELDKVHVQMS